MQHHERLVDEVSPVDVAAQPAVDLAHVGAAAWIERGSRRREHRVGEVGVDEPRQFDIGIHPARLEHDGAAYAVLGALLMQRTEDALRHSTIPRQNSRATSAALSR